MTPVREATSRLMALGAVVGSLAVAGAVTLGATLLAVVLFGGLGPSGLDGLLLGFFVLVVFSLLTALFAPCFVIKRVQERGSYGDLRPKVNGVMVGICLLVLTLLLVATAIGDRTGSDLTALATVCWVLALVAGVGAVTELLHHRWSSAATSVLLAAVLTAGCGVLLFVAALPALLLARDSHTNLPVAVIDRATVAGSDWDIVRVTDYAPQNALITLRRGSEADAGPSAYIRISHHDSRCSDAYDCGSVGETRDGSQVLALTRPCADTQPFSRANLLVERQRGTWQISSDVVTTYCGEEPPPLTVNDLLEVLELLEASSVDEFKAFVNGF